MSGLPLKSCSAFNKLWNNKFYYKFASFWYFYRIILRCTDPWILNLGSSDWAFSRLTGIAYWVHPTLGLRLITEDKHICPGHRNGAPAFSRDGRIAESNYYLIWFQTFAVFCMLYVFFCVIPRRLNCISRRFGTLYLFHLHRQEGE
jgi:hypothetical protein